MDIWRKAFRSEWSFSIEGTCRRPESLITKPLSQNVVSEAVSQRCFQTQPPKKSQKLPEKKNLQWSAKTETPLGVCMTINKNDTLPQTRLSPGNTKSLMTTFSKNTFGELLLVFQLFEKFDLQIRYFTFKFQKLFSYRIFRKR